MADKPAHKKKRNRASGKWITLTCLVVLLVFLFIGVYWVSFKGSPANNAGNSQASKLGPSELQNVSIGDGGGSARHQQAIAQQNAENADVAAKQGKSYIPTVVAEEDQVNSDRLLDSLIEPKAEGAEAKADPQIAQVEVEIPKGLPPTDSPGDISAQEWARMQAEATALAKLQMEARLRQEKAYQEKLKAMQDALLAELQQVTGKIAYEPHKSTVFDLSNEDVQPGIEGKTAAAQTVSTDATEEQLSVVSPLKPGDVLYASINQFLNSDSPLPAITATVLAGEHKGSTLIGGFKRNNDVLAVTFEELVSPTGEVLKFKAFAIDPADTHKSGIASDVDNHYFFRGASLVFSSLAEGFSKALQLDESIKTTSTGPEGVTETVQYRDYSVKDQLLIAAGTLGERTAEIARQNFNREKTVTAVAGSEAAVIVYSVN